MIRVKVTVLQFLSEWLFVFVFVFFVILIRKPDLIIYLLGGGILKTDFIKEDRVEEL